MKPRMTKEYVKNRLLNSGSLMVNTTKRARDMTLNDNLYKFKKLGKKLTAAMLNLAGLPTSVNFRPFHWPKQYLHQVY